MNRFKKLFLWFAVGAGLLCLTGYAPRPGDPAQVWWQSAPRLTKAQSEEWEIMRVNLAFGARLAWHAGAERAMLVKANWIANRLNLPIRRPIFTTDIQDWQVFPPWQSILCQYPSPIPSWMPDTVFGADIYNTNFSRLKRILALKFGLYGMILTPPYQFSFADGQFWDVVRLAPSESEGYADRFAEVMRQPSFHPPLAQATEAYQLATQWLAAVDVNLDMLKKSRLPHPVRQEEYQPPGASGPQSVYFVAWGTNYYRLYWAYHFWHTNEWHPAIMVEIGPHKELLELYVGDPAFIRDPPTCIPSKTVWRLVHTPDPPYNTLTNPAVMQQFILTPQKALNDIPTQEEMTNNATWKYQHHQLDPISTKMYSYELNKLESELIPYKPGWDPVWNTNQP